MFTDNLALRATNRLFTHLDPSAATVIKPYLERLFQAMEEGHTFIQLTAQEEKKLLTWHNLVGSDSTEHRYRPLIVDRQRLFLGRYFDLEKQLAKEINRLASYQPKLPEASTIAKLQTWFIDEQSYDQQAAAALALLKNFVLISGGPGTGKTTTVAKLLALLCTNPLPKIHLAAPTGKAAARLKEALHRAIHTIPNLDQTIHDYLLNLNSQTVHRLLGLKPPLMQPYYHQDRQLVADIVLLDEASMLDSYLLWQILKALPNHCRVILLGDANQLPSVGMGAVLTALTQSLPLHSKDKQQLQSWLPQHHFNQLFLHHARLTISHRFNQHSAIGQLATAVMDHAENKENKSVKLESVFKKFHCELEIAQPNIEHIVNRLYHCHHEYWQAIQQQNIQAAFHYLNQMVVLTVLRDDAQTINLAYYQLLQQHGLAHANQSWFAGQPIMINRNNHIQRLYNGDIGIVMIEEQQAVAYFPDGNGYRKIALNRLSNYEIAFALTVHKSQGSEYQQVWLFAPEYSYQLFNRALLYTAITRAKEKFVYFGTWTLFQAACQQIEQRQTALAEFL